MSQGRRSWGACERHSVQLRGQNPECLQVLWTLNMQEPWSARCPASTCKRCCVGLTSLSQYLGGGDTLESLQPPQVVKGSLNGEHAVITGGTEGPPPCNQIVLTAPTWHVHRRTRSETLIRGEMRSLRQTLSPLASC